MFIPLVDVLRCVRPHDETWLVASIDEAIDRDIVTGTLGCPICLAEYPIRDGIVLFDEDAASPGAAWAAPSEEGAVRLAAALDLVDARMTALLHGRWGAYAPILRGLTPAQLLLVNSPAAITSGDGVSIIRSSRLAPVARASIAAVAVDDGAAGMMLESLIASVRGGGRVMGSVRVAVPHGLAELARDDEVWVAQREPSAAESAPVTLIRRSR
jgi:uncharacterized protein YbaR (Trm112 family)